MPSITEEERKLALELEAELQAEEKAAQDPAPRKEPEPDQEPELRRDPSPAFHVQIPHDAAERLAELSQARADVVRMFEDGEITAREYSDGLERISDRREDIKTRQRMASAAKESHERALDSEWRSNVDRFMAGAGKNIKARGEAAMIAFDSYVQKVTGDAANSRLSDRAQLAKAHKAFLADFGGSFGGDTSSAHVNGGSDFAALDRLAESNPREFERRVAGMTDDEREAYGL